MIDWQSLKNHVAGTLRGLATPPGTEWVSNNVLEAGCITGIRLISALWTPESLVLFPKRTRCHVYCPTCRESAACRVCGLAKAPRHSFIAIHGQNPDWCWAGCEGYGSEPSPTALTVHAR